MNLEVYTFCSILKDYDEDFVSLSFQDQYDAAPKLYKQFIHSKYYNNKLDLIEAITEYLDNKYIDEDFEFDADDDY